MRGGLHSVQHDNPTDGVRSTFERQVTITLRSNRSTLLSRRLSTTAVDMPEARPASSIMALLGKVLMSAQPH